MLEFDIAFRTLQEDVHQTAKAKGWWDEPREEGTLLMLMVGELAEAMEALRAGNPPDKHLSHYSSRTVELADVVIRIMDYAGYHNLPLAEAIEAKAEYNKTRSHRHGGKAF